MDSARIQPVQKDQPRQNWAEIPARFPNQPLYQFSNGAERPQASQQRQPTPAEVWNAPPILQTTGGATINANNDGNFAYLGEEQRPTTGFTNKFLESRDQRHFFDKV